MRASLPPLAPMTATAAGATARFRSRSSSPSAISTRVALGESWIPAPVSASASACSSSVTRKPDWARVSAAVKPPMPAPATMMLREDATARAPWRSGRFGQGAGRRARRVGAERRIVPIERRAIRADDLGFIAHVEVHVRMVERRLRANALELARADLDHGHAGVVVEMRNDVLNHAAAKRSLAYDAPHHSD